MGRRVKFGKGVATAALTFRTFGWVREELEAGGKEENKTERLERIVAFWIALKASLEDLRPALEAYADSVGTTYNRDAAKIISHLTRSALSMVGGVLGGPKLATKLLPTHKKR